MATVDEQIDALLGPQSVDDKINALLGPVPADPSATGYEFGGSANMDELFKHNGPGQVLDAIGHGAAQGWGTDKLGLSDETADELKKAGIFNDYQNGRTSLLKSFNEAVMRPAAVAADTVMRGGMAALTGVAEGAGAIADETGFSRLYGRPGSMLSRDLVTEAFRRGGEIPQEVAKARDLNVVGAGEEGWKGTVEQQAADAEARRRLAPSQEQPAAAQPAPEAPAVAGPPAVPAAEPEAAPDIHATARQIAPETFSGPAGYDALSQQRDTFRGWLDDLAEKRQADAEASAPHAAEIADLNARLADENTTPRRAKKYQARLDDLVPENEAHIADAVSKDTPDMARVRGELQKADERMRDLAPDVSAAYRAAEDRMPAAEPEAAQPAPEPAAEPVGVAERATAPIEAAKAEEPASAPPAAPTQAVEPAPVVPRETARAIEAQRAAITDDVTQKLVAAGRPTEEAQANAALIAAHYEARAERFKGALGTAEELYKAEGPQIKAGRGAAAKAREPEMAQTRRGKIRLSDDRAVITLMKDADGSTFVHETGHQWLEELTRDAEHEKAPADLKADAQTVRDYLGVKEGEAIPTKAHEKFARSFERYMMEGVAPSKGLAKVFAQFKDWLTKIYQTVAKLKAPINEDIRAVFDRMLSTNPERVVIAPELERGKGFADIHEADAETTPPHQAGPVADNVRAEIDAIAKETVPDVVEKLPGRAETEAGGEPAANAGAASGADGAGPLAGGNGRAAEPRKVATGGNEAAAEGGRVRGGAGEGGRADPASPNGRFAEPESGLIDKAGNIRLDKLNQPADFDEILRETANRNGGFMAERRGVITDGQALDLADALGTDPAFLDRKKIGDAFNEEQIIAVKRMLIQSAGAVRDAFAAAKDGDPAMIAKLAETIARHEMIQGKVAQATAEWGRAGRALNMVIEGSKEAKDLNQFLRDNTGRDFNQLQQMAQLGQSLKTPQQVSRLVSDTKAGNIRRAIIFYYVNALISGPVTHARYAAGNAINALWTPLIELPVAATFDAAKAALGHGNPADRVRFGEIGAQLYGFLKGSRDGIGAAVEAFKTGVSPALPGEHVPAQFLEPRPVPIPGAIGRAIAIPGKSVAAIHSFFKSMRYEQNIQALAYRAATAEGLAGDAFSNRVGELTRSPTEAMSEAAARDALKELFMAPSDYHSFSGAMTRLTNHPSNAGLIAKIIVPFMKIGSQITKNALLERTPLGLLAKDVRGNLLGRNGGDAQAMQVAKIGTGMALMGATVLAAAEGLATGDGPEDPAERARWLLNHRPNSIQIGNITLPYQGLGHLGMLMRFSANMYETAHNWDGEDGAKLAVSFFEGLSKSVLDENFMRSVKDTLDAMYHPQEYGARYLRSMVTNWIPFSVGLGQVARMVDPYQRETHTIFDAARAKIPFLSRTLFARRDMFGEPMPSGGNIDRYRDDPTVQAMEAAHLGIGKLDDKIRGVSLIDQQYDDYTRIAGRMAKTDLDQIVAMPGFADLPLGVRVDLMRHAIDTARDIARDLVITESIGTENDIMKKSTDAAVAYIDGGKSAKTAILSSAKR